MNPLAIKALIGAAILALAFGAGWATNGWRLNTKIQTDRAVRTESVVAAVGQRVNENATEEKKQASINKNIDKVKDEELSPVVKHIIAAPRVRVGTAICPSPVARTPEAESASVSNDSDTGGWVVREDLDRDIRALKIKVEEALATGRACQKFVRDNGLAP